MVFASRPRTRVFTSVLSFPLQIEFYAVANQGIELNSQNVYQHQSVLRSSIYIKPVLTFREKCDAFENLLFFGSYFCLWRDFCQPPGPFAARFTLIEDSPKLPWGMQRIRGPFGSFCFKDHHYESFRLQVSRDSLSCATRSLDLYILLKFIFLYLWYIPLLSCTFHPFCFHRFFHMYQYRSPCEIFLLSLMIALIGESSEFNFEF